MNKRNEISYETSFKTLKFLVDSFKQINKFTVMKKDECKQWDKPTLREVLDPSNC